MPKCQKNIQNLNEIIQNAKDYFLLRMNKSDLEKIINDKNSDGEMTELANIELSEMLEKKEKTKKN